MSSSSPAIRQQLWACATDLGGNANPRTVVLQWWRFGAAGLAIVLLAALFHLLPERNPVLAAGKIVVSAIVLGILPGMFIALASSSARSLGLLEGLGLSIALSLPLVEVLTIVSITCHVSCGSMTIWILGALIAAGLLFCSPGLGQRTTALRIDKPELAIAAAIILMAALLYIKGSPCFSDEEQFHISVIGRLASHPHPAIDNFYFAPNIIYTHPFPGTHYFMALVARLAGIDALFTYHKLRWFWTLAGLVFFFLAACRAFPGRHVPYCVFLVGIVFVLNGSFADMRDLYWGQLVSHSHPSDVAMSVLLPGTLAMALSYYQSERTGNAVLYFATTAGMVFLITIVHIREAVQFLVYNGALLVGCLVFHRNRALLLKVAAVCVTGVVVAGAYGWFHHLTVDHVAVVDAVFKADVLSRLHSISVPDLLVGGRITPVESLCWGWHPVLLLASPLLFAIFFRHVPVMFLSMSVLGYLLIIRVPLLSLVYSYCSYYEIFMTTVRNVSYFHYLAAGGILYLTSLMLARLRPFGLAAASAVVLATYLGLLVRWGEQWWSQHADLFLLHAIGLHLVGVMVGVWGRFSIGHVALQAPDGSWKPLFALLVGVLAVCSCRPASSPLDVHTVSSAMAAFPHSTPVALTPGQLIHNLKQLQTCTRIPTCTCTPVSSPNTISITGVSQPPTKALLHWAGENLPVASVLAFNSFNVYAPAVFLPCQQVTWPVASSLAIRHVFPGYNRLFDRAMAKYGTQPFFNDRESPQERLAFVRALGVTHVLVDPTYYALMQMLMAKEPDHYRLLYDAAGWAVYQVVRP